MKINKDCNTFIKRKTGDGFRMIALPEFDFDNSIVIASKKEIEQCYKDKPALTIQQLALLIKENSFPDVKTIYLDIEIPNPKLKTFESLMKLCTGKQIVFIRLPYNTDTIIASIQLISVTKNIKVEVQEFINPRFKNRKFV